MSLIEQARLDLLQKIRENQNEIKSRQEEIASRLLEVTKLSRSLNAVSPIAKLPQDVLFLIFQEYIRFPEAFTDRDDRWKVMNRETEENGSSRKDKDDCVLREHDLEELPIVPQFTLAQVCHTWRKLPLTSSGL